MTPPAASDDWTVVIVPVFVSPGFTVPRFTVPPVTVSRTVTFMALLAPDGSVLENLTVITGCPSAPHADEADCAVYQACSLNICCCWRRKTVSGTPIRATTKKPTTSNAFLRARKKGTI